MPFALDPATKGIALGNHLGTAIACTELLTLDVGWTVGAAGQQAPGQGTVRTSWIPEHSDLSLPLTFEASGEEWLLLHFCLPNLGQMSILANSHSEPYMERDSEKCFQLNQVETIIQRVPFTLSLFPLSLPPSHTYTQTHTNRNNEMILLSCLRMT